MKAKQFDSGTRPCSTVPNFYPNVFCACTLSVHHPLHHHEHPAH